MRAASVVALILVLLPLVGTALGPADATGAGLEGPQPFITLLCKFAGEESEPRPPAYFEGLFGTGAAGLDAYWREVSYGRISLEGSRVAGWYTLARPASDYALGADPLRALAELAQDCLAAADGEVDFRPYVGINLAFNLALDEAAWGGRRCLELDGNSRCFGVTWLWPAAYQKQRMVAHEMGHTFGLHHSIAGAGDPYGSAWDPMSAASGCRTDASYGPLAPHLIAYHKDSLGWIPPERKFVAPPQGEGTVELAALAAPGAPGYLLAEVPIAGAGRFYTVEARVRLGSDAALPDDAVLIHEVEPGREPPARLVNHAADGDTRAAAGRWAPGDLFVDAEAGVAISVDGATASGFVVTVVTGPRPWPLAPAAGAAVAPGRVAFAWRAVGGAAGYALRVSPDGAGAPAHETLLPGGETSAALALGAGRYRWQVRMLPDGPWTPPVRLVVGFAGRRWQPGEIVAAAVGRKHTSPAIAAGPEGVTIAWAKADDITEPVVVRIAHHGPGLAPAGWRLEEHPIPDYDQLTGPLPALAVTPDGRPCGVWMEQRLAPGPAPQDVLGPVDGALWFDCWPQPGAAAARQPGGRPATAVRVNGAEAAALQAQPILVADADGALYAAWKGEVGGSAGLFAAARSPGGEWGAGARIAGAAQPWLLRSPALAGRGGRLAAAWVGEGDGGAIYAAAGDLEGGWSASPTISATGGGRLSNPVVALDAAGGSYAAWQAFGGCSDGSDGVGGLEFAWRGAGSAWSLPERVAADLGEGHVSPPALAAGPGGAVVLVWEEWRAGSYHLFAAQRTAGGGWEPAAAVPGGSGNRFPALPALVLDDAGDAYVTWVDSSGAEPAIRFVRTAGQAGGEARPGTIEGLARRPIARL